MRAVRTLLEHIIDYAGLFPPAKLDMRSAVHRFHQYRESGDAWMLSRFIVPVRRLGEFEDAAAEFLPAREGDEPWALSALVSPADDDALTTDLERLAAFNDRHADAANGLALVDTVELRASDSEAIEAAMELVPEAVFPFFELPADRDVRGLVAALAGGDAGAKVRTGGVAPELFPSPDELARFIRACAAASVPFKATAGLHHPFRHESATVPGAREFGFFNVFLGAALARTERLTQDELITLLDDESPDNFHFEDDSIAWRDHVLTVGDLHAARDNFAASYGSCSFEEPLEDLRTLKLL